MEGEGCAELMKVVVEMLEEMESWRRRKGDVCPSVLLTGTRYCWMSTGLYIPSRHIIEVSLPEAAASADLKVRPCPHPRETGDPNVLALTAGIFLDPHKNPTGNLGRVLVPPF